MYVRILGITDSAIWSLLPKMLHIHPSHECMYPAGQHQENLFDFFGQDSESTGNRLGYLHVHFLVSASIPKPLLCISDGHFCGFS